MRVLFVTAPFRSHLYVQAPLAWAMRTAGHEVYVASAPDLSYDVAHSGLAGIAVGEPVRLNDHMAAAEPAADPVPGDRPVKSRQETYGLDDPAGELRSNVMGWRTLFNPLSAFEDLVRFARTWRPDLVISDTFMFIGAAAARVSGAAYARMIFGADGLGQMRVACHARWREYPAEAAQDPMREWLQPILERYGCAFDEEAVLGQWSIFPMPTYVWRPAGIHYLPMRHVPFNGPSGNPTWVFEPSDRRRICVTLGLAHREGAFGVVPSAGDIFEAVGDLDVEVVATLNAYQLRSAPKPPDNVRVVDFVPLNALLPGCSAIVHTGGAGTFAAAVENAVPQLIVPNIYWSEKWWGPVAMANAVEDRGAGLYVADANQLTVELLREGLLQVLEKPSFAHRAAQLRAEALAMPSPNDVVPALEKLTAERRAGVRLAPLGA